MTEDPQALRWACLSIAQAMKDLFPATVNGDLTPALCAAWSALEREALTLGKEADFSLCHDDRIVLHSRSEKILSLLPDEAHKRLLPSADLNACLRWITPSHLALVIAKGRHPARSAAGLIDHMPGDPDWDDLVTGPFSEAGPATDSMNSQENFAVSKNLLKVRNLPRLALYLRAQARHQPEAMRTALARALQGQAASPFVALALIQAGVPVDFELTPDPALKEVYDLGRSNHGRLRLMERHGSLEDSLSAIQAGGRAVASLSPAPYRI